MIVRAQVAMSSQKIAGLTKDQLPLAGLRVIGVPDVGQLDSRYVAAPQAVATADTGLGRQPLCPTQQLIRLGGKRLVAISLR